MEVLQLTFNCFGVNTYVVYEPESRECAVIDPGMSNEKEQYKLQRLIEDKCLKPVHLVNTHLHVDHVIGNGFIRSCYGLKVEANNADAFLGISLGQQKQMFGMFDDGNTETIDVNLTEGEKIQIGNTCLVVLEVPGHSPGGLALYDKDSGFVIVGDSLFNGSIGRTDLPGGDMNVLLDAVHSKLLTLPDDTKVYPGHGPATTISVERRCNPYLI